MSAAVANPINPTSVFAKPINRFIKVNALKDNLNNFLLTAHSEISQLPNYELNDESSIETLTASIQTNLGAVNSLSTNSQSIQKTVAFSAAYTMQQALFNGEVSSDKMQDVIAESNELYIKITEKQINSSTDLACAINHTLNQIFLNTGQLSFETKQSMAQKNTKQIAELLTNHHTGNSALSPAQVTVLTSNMCYHFERNHACTPEQAKQFAQKFMAVGFKNVDDFLQLMTAPQDDVAPQQGLQSLPLASHVLDSLGGQAEQAVNPENTQFHQDFSNQSDDESYGTPLLDSRRHKEGHSNFLSQSTPLLPEAPLLAQQQAQTFTRGSYNPNALYPEGLQPLPHLNFNQHPQQSPSIIVELPNNPAPQINLINKVDEVDEAISFMRPNLRVPEAAALIKATTQEIAKSLTTHKQSLNTQQLENLNNQMVYHFNHNHRCDFTQARALAEHFISQGHANIEEFLKKIEGAPKIYSLGSIDLNYLQAEYSIEANPLLSPQESGISQGLNNSSKVRLPRSREIMEQQALRKATNDKARREKEEADTYKASLEQAE